jgi:hypothetical protein
MCVNALALICSAASPSIINFATMRFKPLHNSCLLDLLRDKFDILDAPPSHPDLRVEALLS